MKKDEKIMLQHAISGKFGNDVDLSEGLTKPQEVKIDHDKKEIIIKSYDGAFDLTGLKSYQNYDLELVRDETPVFKGKVGEAFND